MDYVKQLQGDRYAMAALSTKLKQPRLSECAFYLMSMELKRGKPMTDDHLKQEAVKWARQSA